MNFLDVFYRVLVCPRSGLKTFALPGSGSISFLLFVLGSLAISVTFAMLGQQLSGQAMSSANSGYFLFSYLRWVNFLFFGWVIYTGIAHLWAGLLKTHGSVLHLFRSLSVIFVPAIFVLPVVLLVSHGSGLIAFFGAVLLLGLVAWLYVLVINAFRQVYDIDFTKALLIAIGPIAAWVLGWAVFFFTTLVSFIFALAA